MSESWPVIGMETLSRVRCGLGEGGFPWIAAPQGIREFQTLKELHAAEARLQTLGTHCRKIIANNLQSSRDRER
jgi:hypothetical protein